MLLRTEESDEAGWSIQTGIVTQKAIQAIQVAALDAPLMLFSWWTCDQQDGQGAEKRRFLADHRNRDAGGFGAPREPDAK